MPLNKKESTLQKKSYSKSDLELLIETINNPINAQVINNIIIKSITTHLEK